MKKLIALALFLNIAVLTLALGCSDSDSTSGSEEPATPQTTRATSPQPVIRYPEVKIGSQVWMAENLDVSTFRNGDPIPEAKTDAEWGAAGDAQKPAWCYHDNDPANGKTYGKLYNWYAVSDSRGLAPRGWHVPADEEWNTLINHLGGEDEAGGKLKETGTAHWQSPNTGASNSSGFTALPGGGRLFGSIFFSPDDFAGFWSATEFNSNLAYHWNLNYDHSIVYRGNSPKGLSGFSVRCVKD